MGTAAENFCLRWNDFESNVSGAFRELRAEADFFDVTLAADESNGRTLQAHKVILSACSSVFKQMLRHQSHHPSPLIYMRGIRLPDLECILDFMYHGEVNVAQEDLNRFLAVAEDLQVKGLTQTNSKVGGKRVAAVARKAAAAIAAKNDNFPVVKKRRIEDDTKEEIRMDDNSDSGKLEGQESGEGYVAEDGSYSFSTSENTGAEEGTETLIEGQDKAMDFNQLVQGLLTYENGIHTCNICGKGSRWRTTIIRHMEANHVETAGHVCDICGTVLKTRHSYFMHKKRKHGIVIPTKKTSADEATTDN